MPFDDSRRLTGPNLYFRGTGAVLDARVPLDERLLDAWRTRVARAAAALGLGSPATAVRRHAHGTMLALAAPCDRLFAATEVNEWALLAALAARDPDSAPMLEQALVAAAYEAAADPASVIPPVLEERAALTRLAGLASREARPDLMALLAAADVHRLPSIVDEETLTIGAGARGRSWPLATLPAPGSIDWPALGDIPTAVVTGSNGKTTTVRLIAACARAAGLVDGYNCTDGVRIAGEPVAEGDYSGPVGARRVLRDARTTAAVIETARGGILRRGLALGRARAAVVTNVSADHFGEYGIDDLEGLADVKLTVATLVPADGLVVLNADDALLVARATGLAARCAHPVSLGWFALDADAPRLVAHRAAGGATAGVRRGRLVAGLGGAGHDLGEVAAMPITAGGHAAYNVQNLAAAALAALALGVPPATVAAVATTFGADPLDNPGRLMRYRHRGAEVLIDYAHNPEGLRGVLAVARHLQGPGRLAVLLGHAGNRRDEDIREVARVAASFAPDLVVVKEEEAYLRGRALGEIPRLMEEALLAAGLPHTAVVVRPSELEAVRTALEWARPGDVLALLVHSAATRVEVVELVNTERS